MLGGVEWGVRLEVERDSGEGEEEISREETDRVVRKLKEGKALGGDGIVNKVWKYGGEDVKEWLWEICNRTWKGNEVAGGVEGGSGGAGDEKGGCGEGVGL